MDVEAPIVESWARIEAWLAAHAPASHARLNPPAEPDQIAETERQIGVALPPDLRSLLLRHDGASHFDARQTYRHGAAFLPLGHALIPVAEIAEVHRMLTGILGEYDDSMVGWWWHPLWVPFAQHDTGDALVIDQRPGPMQGTIGELMHEDHARFEHWPSLRAMMADIADALEQRRPLRLPGSEHRPVVKDGALHWDITLLRDQPNQ